MFFVYDIVMDMAGNMQSAHTSRGEQGLIC